MTPSIPAYSKRPWSYDSCSECGSPKRKGYPKCKDCTNKRAPIEQPEDPAIRHIPLNKGMFAIVDAVDFERINRWTWYVHTEVTGGMYAQRSHHSDSGRCQTYKMHREVMGIPHRDKAMLDHINGNGLDNRRANLRLCTQSQNTANARLRKDNTTGFKGVSLNKKNGKYRASIKRAGKCIVLGHCDSPSEAAEIYRKAAIDSYGEFARFE